MYGVHIHPINVEMCACICFHRVHMDRCVCMSQSEVEFGNLPQSVFHIYTTSWSLNELVQLA